MNWFQRDSNASRDIKLVKLFNRYRHEGRDLYWEVVSRIAEKLEGLSICFFLEETSLDLATDQLIDLPIDRVDAILNYCVELKLLEREVGSGRIGCPKILYRLNNNMIKNQQVKEMIKMAQRFKPENKGVRRDYVGTTPTDRQTDRENKEEIQRLEGVLGRKLNEHELANLDLPLFSSKTLEA